jgi:DNA-binding NtrC family response regulator
LPARIREWAETEDGESSRGRVLTLRESEIRMIRRALRHTGGNKARAAKLLGINITTLYRKIKSFGLAEKPLQNANEICETQ